MQLKRIQAKPTPFYKVSILHSILWVGSFKPFLDICAFGGLEGWPYLYSQTPSVLEVAYSYAANMLEGTSDSICLSHASSSAIDCKESIWGTSCVKLTYAISGEPFSMSAVSSMRPRGMHTYTHTDTYICPILVHSFIEKFRCRGEKAEFSCLPATAQQTDQFISLKDYVGVILHVTKSLVRPALSRTTSIVDVSLAPTAGTARRSAYYI